MNTSVRFYLCAGAFFALLSVILGAFGAHALKPHLTLSLMAAFKTAVQYQMFHALALLVLGMLQHIMGSSGVQNKRLRLVGNLFLVGIVLFCGSLYLLAMTGVKVLGVITPFGGLTFIAAWLVLLYALLRADVE